MKKSSLIVLGLLVPFYFGFVFSNMLATDPVATLDKQHNTPSTFKGNAMKLGAFSMSLSVKDLAVSKQFYEKLGFTSFAGKEASGYLIMKNGNALIGLFHGMFQGNILTFNPGWDENAGNVDPFDDVREIQRRLKSDHIALTTEADEKTSGPASITLTDPDGNVILIDQHR